MKQYVFSTSDKRKIFTIEFQQNSHCFGFLSVDMNRNTDVYSIGKVSGIKTISKGSGLPTPIMDIASNNVKIKIELDAWSNAFLIVADTVTLTDSVEQGVD